MPPKPISSKAESVKVVIRCRPMNSKETADGHERVVDMDAKLGLIEVKAKSGEPPKQFTFDAVYDWNSKQRDLYDESFRDLVQAVLEGFNGTIFAYGQTGTGKTFTMQGVKNEPEQKGVIPNSFDHIFSHISRSQNQEFLVRASYLEIYMEEIKDLLAADQNKRLELKERPDTGVYIKDLSSFVTKSCKEIEHVMNRGNQNRAVGATNMNEQSSRSHAIFIITVECSEMGLDDKSHIRVGKLNLVDLAGSERQSKTGSEGDRLKEATKINLSLSALGNVISALVDGKSTHIPYRDSKLTRLLQDSLGGNSKTVMVANIGPASYNVDETVTTLRYANRAKNIKNKPKINEDPKDALLREFQEELARLKEQLNTKGGGGAGASGKKQRKKKRTGPNGEELSGDEDGGSGGEGGGEGEDEENYMNEQMAKLEQEKQAILNNKSLISGEKEKLLADMEEKEHRLQKEKEAKDVLQKKIQAMESKLLTGGKNIIDHTNEQQKALEQRRLEIAEQQRKERDIQRKLEEQEESAVNIQGTYNSLQQEVEAKTKRLKKLYSKLQAVKAEIRDVQEEHVKERQELEQTQNELTRELKLKMLIIENFIPPEEKTRMLERAEFDEEEQTWKLKLLAKGGSDTMAKRPASAVPGRKWPVSDFGKKMSTLSGGFRFAGENILSLDLDLPNRTTRDYEGPSIAPRIQAVLDAAMEDEGDIDIEEHRSKSKKNGISSSGHSKTTNHRKKEQEMYPTSRGLVPK